MNENKDFSLKTIPHFVNGKHYLGNSNKYLPVYNPATGIKIKKINVATVKEVDVAVEHAKIAFKKWHNVPVSKRARIFFKYLQLLENDIDNFAKIVSLEHGKTLEDAIGSIGRGIEIIEYCTGITGHLKSEYHSNVANNIDVFNIRQPLGVCVGITPFNFPEMVPMWMYPIAIACGNTFVLKPSEKNPSASIYQAEKLKEAGLPDGVFNVINGDKEVVERLLEHKDVKAISFVGSTVVGKKVYQKGITHGKRVQALCSAKNHLVVMPDANIDFAVESIIGSAYGAAGERCMAISVVVAVGDDIADNLINKLILKVKSLKVGSFDQKEVEMGPIITKESFDNILSFIKSGVDQGANLVVDGRNIKIKNHEKGFFLGGCLFDNVKSNMEIYKKEIFGPVLSIVRVNDYKQAINLINDHEFGNGVAIFTNDAQIIRKFTIDVKIGMVGINVPIPVPIAYHSFGGWKNSIFGSNFIYGPEGIRFYTNLKTITQRLSENIIQKSQFNFIRGSDQ